MWRHTTWYVEALVEAFSTNLHNCLLANPRTIRRVNSIRRKAAHGSWKRTQSQTSVRSWCLQIYLWWIFVTSLLFAFGCVCSAQRIFQCARHHSTQARRASHYLCATYDTVALCVCHTDHAAQKPPTALRYTQSILRIP